MLAFAPAPMGSTPGPSMTALLQAWKDLRRELEPMVRVTRLDQVPDGAFLLLPGGLLPKLTPHYAQARSFGSGLPVRLPGDTEKRTGLTRDAAAGSPLWPAEIADPRNPATPPGLAAARPDAEKIARDGEHVLVRSRIIPLIPVTDPSPRRSSTSTRPVPGASAPFRIAVPRADTLRAADGPAFRTSGFLARTRTGTSASAWT